jgi:wyosine [tRNA(Phe)-imidazoG37] synthetase (radical SAM superfamily)
MKKSKYIFGPVPSRRLGLSLGVDIIPLKTCSFDCIFCQTGRTTDLTVERKDYVPAADVISQIKDRLSEVSPDFITVSGSGEPTLNASIGKIISEIKKITRIPVAVFTNSSMLIEKEVRSSLASADLIKVSLSAGDENILKKINRAHPEITLKRLVQGMIKLREEFSGQIWLEIFVIDGMNDNHDQIGKISGYAGQIKPDRIHLNTAVRPPAEAFVKPVNHERLEELSVFFNSECSLIGSFERNRQTRKKTKVCFKKDAGSEILEMLKRRPCSIEDLANGLNLENKELFRHVEKLINEKLIKTEIISGIVYYKI